MNRKDYKTIPADTRRIISGSEGQKVEFKRLPSAIDQKDLISFANSEGGLIFAGVDEETNPDTGIQSGRVVGCDVSDTTQRSIIQKAENCSPSVNVIVSVENKSTKPILRVEITGNIDRPYCTSSGDYKVRNGALNGKISPYLMKQFVIESESEIFVKRFKEAGVDILNSLYDLEESLLYAVQSAEDAANEARDAVEESTDHFVGN